MLYPNDQNKFLADIKRDEIDSRNLRDSGTESDRTDAATCFYPILIKDNKVIGFGEVPDDNYHPGTPNITLSNGTIEVWPIDSNGNEKKWRYGRESVPAIKEKLEPKLTSSYQIIFNQDMGTMKSLWHGAQYDASEYGTKVLQSILSVEGAKNFSYPKSLNTVVECTRIALNNKQNSVCLDYFAGSGTTAHAIIKQNRENESPAPAPRYPAGENSGNSRGDNPPGYKFRPCCCLLCGPPRASALARWNSTALFAMFQA
jgi:adenine-specific DNA-methyltransferase